MSAAAVRRYNPGFLTDDELVASFCVRTHEFESLVESLSACTGDSNQHQIVIGPRGSGKTSLLLRVAAEVRRNADLATCFFPIVFAEESYEVSTAGEFWLECLARLADQAPEREDAPNLHGTLTDLRAIQDDQMLSERCLATLLDFADREGKRLVLMVENLNMMFRDMMDSQAGWRLRKILQTEPRIILLASATSRFNEIDRPDHALYDLFRVLTLSPLTTDECAVLWETVSGQSRPTKTIRPLEILTGGSPRLLTIVARFGAGLSFRELMNNLLDLVDDHTEYFKSHLESLAVQERRVYLALADLWTPAFTNEIAERARLGTSKCSAQLKRLVERGAVLVAGGSARRKQYYLSERMYNIYYLLRRGQDRLVEVLIRFMEAYYSPEKRWEIGTRIAHEAEDVAPEERSLYLSVSAQLIAKAVAGQGEEEREASGVRSADDAQALEVLAAYDEVVRRFGDSDAPELLEQVAMALVNKGVELGALNRRDEALAAYDEVLRRFGDSAAPGLLERVAMALVNKGVELGALRRPEEELAAYDEVVRRFGERETPELLERVAKALVYKGITLGALNRRDEALAAYDEVVRRFGERETPEFLERVAKALVYKGITLGALNRRDEALAAYGEVVRRFGDSATPELLEQVAKALVNQGVELGALNRRVEALAACGEVVRRFGDSAAPELLEQVAMALVNQGVALGALNRRDEALAACGEVVRRFGDSATPGLLERVATALLNQGVALGAMGRPEEELAAYDEVVRRFGESETPELLERVAKAHVYKGITLGALNRRDEALAAYGEVVRRFGDSAAPELLEQVAMALFSKGVALGALNRRDEALAAYGEVVRRFGDSAVPELLERVAKALVNKGFELGALNRRDEALDAYDEVVRRFGDSDAPELLEQVAMALVNKGVELGALNRRDEALAAYDEVLRRFGDSAAPGLLERVARALVNKGVALGALNRRDEALDAYDEVVRRFGDSAAPELFEQAANALFNKSIVLAELSCPAPPQDITALLTILPKLDSPKSAILALMRFSVPLGPERMLELIQASPAAELLGPLTTALEREMGLDPRAPEEVSEVAEDIRRDLAKLREGHSQAG